MQIKYEYIITYNYFVSEIKPLYSFNIHRSPTNMDNKLQVQKQSSKERETENSRASKGATVNSAGI